MEFNHTELTSLLKQRLAVCPRFSEAEKANFSRQLDNLNSGSALAELRPMLDELWSWEQDRIIGHGTQAEMDILLEEQKKFLDYCESLLVR